MKHSKKQNNICAYTYCEHVIMQHQGCNAFRRMEEIINYKISEKLAVRVGMSCIQGVLS